MPKHSQLRPLWNGASKKAGTATWIWDRGCLLFLVSAVGPLGGVKPKQRALASGFIKHVHLFSHCWFYYRVMVLLVLGCSSFFLMLQLLWCYACRFCCCCCSCCGGGPTVVVAPAVVFEPRNMWPRSAKSELKPSMTDQPWKIFVKTPTKWLMSQHNFCTSTMLYPCKLDLISLVRTWGGPNLEPTSAALQIHQFQRIVSANWD